MPRAKARLLFLLPVLTAIVAYANSLPGDFVFDDEVLIGQGSGLKEFDLHRVFLENYWGPERADRNYRPLLLLTYALNFQVSSEAWSFHAVNLLLNAALALLVWLLLREILRDPTLAALGAALYATLPIHTEAVSNIVGRAELLAALAIFGAWLVVLRARRSGDSRPEAFSTAALAAGITLLGLLCKENTVIVPPLLVAGAVVLRRRIPWKSAALSTIAVLVYVALRAAVLQGKQSVVTFVDNPLYGVDPLMRALNGLRLLALYAWKIVVPVHLCADYSYQQIPVFTPACPILWASALAVAGVLAAAVLAARRKAPVIALAAVFFPLAFSLTCNAVIPIGTIFGERLAFTPSLAWPLLLCGIFLLPALSARPGLRLAVFGILIAAYGARTWTRNRDWASASGMYIRMSADAPDSTRSQKKAAEGYFNKWASGPRTPERRHLLEKSKAAIARALEIYPENAGAMATLGEIYLREGRYEEAIDQFNRAEPIWRRQRAIQPALYGLRGQALFLLKRYQEAFKELDRYLREAPRAPVNSRARAHKLRGLCLALQGRTGQALGDFTAAVRLRPDLPEAWNNRAMALSILGRYNEAIADWEKALALSERLAAAGKLTPDDLEVTPARLRAKIKAARSRRRASLPGSSPRDTPEKPRTRG